MANRVSDDLYSRRLSIARALSTGTPDTLPLGNRVELQRWRETVAAMFAALWSVEGVQPEPLEAAE